MRSRSAVLRCLRPTLAIALVACAAGAASAAQTISRFTIDGGGATRSTGGTFGLGGTTGQPDAGRVSGGSFMLNGGFWAGGGEVATAVPSDDSGHAAAIGTAPLAFRLHPARPNPVAERTVIAFDLPASGPVRAALYDVTGRLLRVLVHETLPGGTHRRTWDGRDGSGRRVAAGVYFLRLEAGTHQSRQKIVVLS